MKVRTLVSLLLIGVMSSISLAGLVDDFESYSTGKVDTVTTAWKGITSGTGFATIAADPTNSANQVLSAATYGSGARGTYSALSNDNIIADNTTSTLSLKFYMTATTCDTSFGLTSIDAPSTFSQFNVQCAIIAGAFKVRNGDTISDALASLSAQTWYYLWVEINNTSNTYSVYLNSTGGSYSSADLLYSGAAFRSNSGVAVADGNLDYFMALSNNSNGAVANTAVLFDDIAITAVPEPATMLLLGLGGLMLGRKR